MSIIAFIIFKRDKPLYFCKMIDVILKRKLQNAFMNKKN